MTKEKKIILKGFNGKVVYMALKSKNPKLVQRLHAPRILCAKTNVVRIYVLPEC